MVRITVNYDGDLHCCATHEPSQAQLATDAPTDNQGRGESFSPTDLVATALATCIPTIPGIQAQQRGWDLTGMRVEVEKHMSEDAPRRITRLPVHIRMPVRLAREDRLLLEHAALTCPVHRSLHPDLEASIVMHWPDEGEDGSGL